MKETRRQPRMTQGGPVMNVMVVDDEKEIADLVEVCLKNEDITVYKCHTAEDALRCLESVRLDMAILDVMLPGISGFDICRKIREKYTALPGITRERRPSRTCWSARGWS